MVAPLLFVIHGDPLFSLATGLNHRAVDLNNRLVEELVRLLLPNTQPCMIERLSQIQNIKVIKAATEVAGRRRIRNSFRTDRVEIRFIGTPELQMIQARSTGE